ncbi:MAG: hypothetical protein M1826_001191 [Phylliscum demangeonii]|nr:MAG: hypothetical protein M1826_001191 [Phylliscum demangeonii]
MTITCKPCRERSTHRITKQGYYRGTVLVTCPGCKNRHVISDHLKVFYDKSKDIEEMMREKGELVQRGTLGADGTVEFMKEITSTAKGGPEG